MGIFMSKIAEFLRGFDPYSDLVDLKGKVALVTGGNRGIGYWTVVHLAKKGAKVYLCARDEVKCQAAIDAMKTELDKVEGSGEVVFLRMDLVDPRKVHAAALYVLENENRVDIIVNNAAIPCDEYEETEEGIAKHMVVNHISHFLLVKTLSPLLQSTASEEGSQVRVVTVTSTAHSRVSNIEFDSLQSFNTQYPSKSAFTSELATYGQTKLANILMSRELQRRYDVQGIPITCIAVHPGFVGTDGAYYSFRTLHPAFLFHLLLKLICISEPKGAYTSVFAAASRQVQADSAKYHGSYLVPYGKIAKTAPLAEDPALAKVLWETTEKILDEKYAL